MTHPASIAFLLDREFPKILSWHQGKLSLTELGVASYFIQRHQSTVRAWVEHNLAHSRQVSADSRELQTGFLNFWDQIQLIASLSRNSVPDAVQRNASTSTHGPDNPIRV